MTRSTPPSRKRGKMNKININGKYYVSVKDIRTAIREMRRTVKERYSAFDEDHQAMVHLAYNDMNRWIYKDELAKAHTPDEIRQVHELQGDYVVVKSGEKKVFCGFWKGIPIIKRLGHEGKDPIVFAYKSMAEGIAEMLGDGWTAIDVGEEEMTRVKAFMDALFEEDDDE